MRRFNSESSQVNSIRLDNSDNLWNCHSVPVCHSDGQVLRNCTKKTFKGLHVISYTVPLWLCNYVSILRRFGDIAFNGFANCFVYCVSMSRGQMLLYPRGAGRKWQYNWLLSADRYFYRGQQKSMAWIYVVSPVAARKRDDISPASVEPLAIIAYNTPLSSAIASPVFLSNC